MKARKGEVCEPVILRLCAALSNVMYPGAHISCTVN